MEPMEHTQTRRWKWSNNKLYYGVEPTITVNRLRVMKLIKDRIARRVEARVVRVVVGGG